MSEKNKETRINIEDLPQSEKELSAKEAKEVKGGGVTLENVQITSYQLGVTPPVDPHLKTK